MPGVLLIAAHPDDETIGAGVLASKTRDIGIVHATNGSPLELGEAYAQTRRTELLRALSMAGVSRDSTACFHFIDQQLAFHLEELSLRIAALMNATRPQAVLTHPYEGGHPDHDAVALACHAATRVYQKRRKAGVELIEFTSYHFRNGALHTYEFLPARTRGHYRHWLTQKERELKQAMLRCFATQARTLRPFTNPEFEAFRSAPDYDFSRPPHEGKLFYEHFQWGVDGQTWRELAARALSRIRA